MKPSTTVFDIRTIRRAYQTGFENTLALIQHPLLLWHARPQDACSWHCAYIWSRVRASVAGVGSASRVCRKLARLWLWRICRLSRNSDSVFLIASIKKKNHWSFRHFKFLQQKNRKYEFLFKFGMIHPPHRSSISPSKGASEWKKYRIVHIISIYGSISICAYFFWLYRGVLHARGSDSDAACVRGWPLNRTTFPRSNGAAALQDHGDPSVRVRI